MLSPGLAETLAITAATVGAFHALRWPRWRGPGTGPHEERCAKVDRWQNSNQRQRWLATALLEVEPRLRKIKGYRHLAQLREALKRELKIGRKSSEKQAA